MAIVSSSIFSSNSIIYLQPHTNPNPLTKHTTFKPKPKNLQPPKVYSSSSSSSSSIPYQPINVNYLETEFSGHGVSFTPLGESCVVRMSLNNGSVSTLMLPIGLITSYKAPMWHGGLLELLHTSVSDDAGGEGAVIRGGVSLVFTCGDENDGSEWSPSVWNLLNVGGSPDDSIQVELISSNSEAKIEIKHIVTLQQDAISSEVVITNLRSSSLQLMGSIVGHLAVSTPEASYAVGLENSNYFVKPPIFSTFSIIPPDFNNNDSGSRTPWVQVGFKQLLSGWGLGISNDGSNDKTEKNGQEEDEEIEGEEEDNYKHLTEKMSMIYTSAPRSFTIMDRGKRNSVVVGREGFNELYIFSPGSSHKPYGKYSYLCIGQAALLKPVTIGPKSEWRGGEGMASSQPSKKAIKSTGGNGGVSSGQSVKFARRTSSGRYVGLSKDDIETSDEQSGDYTNYTVHIPPTPDNRPTETSVATKAEEQYVSNSLFTGGFNSVTRAHLMDKVIDSEVSHPQMAGSKGSSCAMPACDGRVMKDERGVDIDPCECRFKICKDCFLDAQKETGLCPGCKEPYKTNDGDDDSPTGTLSLSGQDGKRTSMMKRNQNGEFDQNKWLFNETSGTYGVGNAYWPPDGSDGKSGGGGLGDPADKPWRPLTRRIPIPMSIISPYRLLIAVRFIVLCFFLTWRVSHPNNDAIWLWFMSIVCEIWFAFSWILDQVPKLCPINRSVDLQLLHDKFEIADKTNNPKGRSDLPGVDFFVSTADPEKEPPLVTANTILSILAIEYPVEKIACYISDDGGALLTFEAMAEACSFADLWVPFCRKHDIEPRNPDTYFSLKGDPTKNKKRLDFVKDRRRVKREYDEFKVRINNLPDSIRRRSDAFNAREEMKVIKSIRESGVDPTEPIKVKRATWMADGTHWPGTWASPSPDHAKGDHAGILQVMLKPPSPDPLQGSGEDSLVDYSDVDIRLPMFVYMSREKRPGYDHNKKAGAMNALVRSSAVLSNGPFILNLDCDHYVYNRMAVREGICFMMDRGGEDICYIQFPQRFEGIDPSDRYANHNTVFFDGNMRALDGVQGPFYVGTGCMFRRFALYGFDPPKVEMLAHEKKGGDGIESATETQALKATDFDPDLDVNELPKRFGNSTLLSNSIPVAEFQGRPIADHPAVKYGRPPGVLRNAREQLDATTVAEAVSVISCWYEDKTEWGDRVGWIYGSVTEDVVTGYRMHNRGWRSIYCLTKRDAFRGSAPINLTDRLHQVLRWATGSVEIFFSRNNAFLASKRLKWLQRLAYLNVGLYPFTSLFLIVYCFLPALSLFSGHFIVKNLNTTFLVYLLLMTLCLIGLAVLEVRWSEVSLEDWWRNEQFWLISGTSSHLAAVVQGLLKVMAGIEISFTLTSKAVEDSDDVYAELYLVKWTSLMIPPIVIAMINVLAMVVAFARTIYSINPQWGKFIGGAFFSFWVLAHLFPFFKGLMGRRGKTPTIVFVWSGLIAITLSLLWVAINPSAGPSDAAAGGSNFKFP